MITRTAQTPTSRRPSASSHRTAAQPSTASGGASSRTPQEPLLQQAARSQNDLQDVLGLLGWGDLPIRLLLVIFDDLTAFAMELKGEYATVCPYVLQRRRSVDHWIACWKEGLCTLDAAVQALQPAWEGEGAHRTTLQAVPVKNPAREGASCAA